MIALTIAGTAVLAIGACAHPVDHGAGARAGTAPAPLVVHRSRVRTLLPAQPMRY